jgi:hypothetical protein
VLVGAFDCYPAHAAHTLACSVAVFFLFVILVILVIFFISNFISNNNIISNDNDNSNKLRCFLLFFIILIRLLSFSFVLAHTNTCRLVVSAHAHML